MKGKPKKKKKAKEGKKEKEKKEPISPKNYPALKITAVSLERM